MSAADAITRRAGSEPIAAAIVLGTGLGPLADAVEGGRGDPLCGSPRLSPCGVSGHAGRLVIGHLGGRRVAVLQGRVHTYETGDPRAMKPVIDTLKALGVPRLLLTNAAGSLRPDMPPGSLMVIEDHIACSDRTRSSALPATTASCR